MIEATKNYLRWKFGLRAPEPTPERWPITWPTGTFIWPTGTFIHIDGGTLDLGLVRDAVLNSNNDFQVFAEAFGNVAKSFGNVAKSFVHVTATAAQATEAFNKFSATYNEWGNANKEWGSGPYGDK